MFDKLDPDEYVLDMMLLLLIVPDVRALQPENAELPMLVTLLGMVMEVKPVQPLKAWMPMLVTLYVFPS